MATDPQEDLRWEKLQDPRRGKETALPAQASTTALEASEARTDLVSREGTEARARLGIPPVQELITMTEIQEWPEAPLTKWEGDTTTS